MEVNPLFELIYSVPARLSILLCCSVALLILAALSGISFRRWFYSATRMTLMQGAHTFGCVALCTNQHRVAEQADQEKSGMTDFEEVDYFQNLETGSHPLVMCWP